MTRGARILAFPGLGLLGLLCAWPVASSAQDARPIEVEVRVIYAAKEKGVIEPDCVGIQKQLLPMRFGSMQVVQSQRFQLVPGGDPAQFELPTGRPVRLEAHATSAPLARLVASSVCRIRLMTPASSIARTSDFAFSSSVSPSTCMSISFMCRAWSTAQSMYSESARFSCPKAFLCTVG